MLQKTGYMEILMNKPQSNFTQGKVRRKGLQEGFEVQVREEGLEEQVPKQGSQEQVSRSLLKRNCRTVPKKEFARTGSQATVPRTSSLRTDL